MKKAIGLILSIMLSAFFIFGASAAVIDGDGLFTIDIPDEFKQTDDSSGGISYEREDGAVFSGSYVAYEENEEAFCPANLSAKEIESYAQNLVNESTEAVKDYTESFNMQVLSAEKVKRPDGSKAIVIKFKTEVKRGEKTETFYQILYELGGKNNKFSFTYTTLEKEKINDFNRSFESIIINEGYAKSNADNAKNYIIAAVMALLLFGGIIRFIRTPEKRKNGKL